jgi:hypothetical protein
MDRQLSIYANVLKTKYGPRLPELFAIDNEFQTYLPVYPATLGGDGLIIPNKISPDVSGGMAGPMAAIPAAGSPTYDRYRLWGTYLRRRFTVWDEAVDYSKGEGSYVDALQDAIDESLEWCKHIQARDMFWGRQMGIGTALDQFGGAGTITCRNTYAIGGSASFLADARGTRYLVVGQRFNVVDPATGNLRSAAVTGFTEFYVTGITSITVFTHGCIDATGAEVGAGGNLITGGGGLTTGDAICTPGSFNLGATPETIVSPRGFQTYGLDEIISDGTDIAPALWGTYGGMNRAAVPASASLVQAVGAGLTNTPDMIRRMSMAIGARSGRPWNGDLLCNPALLEVIPPMVTGGTWYQPQSAPLGYPDDAIVWNTGNGNKKFRTSQLCMYNTIFYVDREHMHRFSLREMAFDERGGILKPYSAGGFDFPATTGWLQCGYQIFSDQPNRHGKMTNLTGIDDAYGFGTGFLYLR